MPVKFVVMHDGTKGKVPREMLHDQITVLNKGFGGTQAQAAPDTKIAFRLESAL